MQASFPNTHAMFANRQLIIRIVEANLFRIFDSLSPNQDVFVQLVCCYDDGREKVVGATEPCVQGNLNPRWNERFVCSRGTGKTMKLKVCVDHLIRSHVFCGEVEFELDSLWNRAMAGPQDLQESLIKRGEQTGVLLINIALQGSTQVAPQHFTGFQGTSYSRGSPPVPSVSGHLVPQAPLEHLQLQTVLQAQEAQRPQQPREAQQAWPPQQTRAPEHPHRAQLAQHAQPAERQPAERARQAPGGRPGVAAGAAAARAPAVAAAQAGPAGPVDRLPQRQVDMRYYDQSDAGMAQAMPPPGAQSSQHDAVQRPSAQPRTLQPMIGAGGTAGGNATQWWNSFIDRG